MNLTQPNPPRSSSESCAFVTDGDNEEEGMNECERGEVRRFGWGPDQRLSDKDEDALREDDRLCSWLSRQCGTFGW